MKKKKRYRIFSILLSAGLVFGGCYGEGIEGMFGMQTKTYVQAEEKAEIPEPMYSYNFDNNIGTAQVVTRLGDNSYGSNVGAYPQPDSEKKEIYKKGVRNQALYLDGSYGLLLEHEKIGKSYTVSFWVKPEKLQQWSSMLFVGDGIFGDTGSWFNATQRYSEYGWPVTPYLWSYSGILKDHRSTSREPDMGESNTGELNTGEQSDNLPRGIWSHVLFSVDGNSNGKVEGTRVMNCYINGELINSGEVAWDIWDSKNVSTYLGINYWDPAFYGYLDDLEIYNTAVTAEQAKAIMNRYESEINTYDDFIIVDHVLTGYQGIATDIVIPEEVTEIGSSVFYGKNITSVQIPETVKKIGAAAFLECKELKELVIPDSVINIEQNAFDLSTVIKCKKNSRAYVYHLQNSQQGCEVLDPDTKEEDEFCFIYKKKLSCYYRTDKAEIADLSNDSFEEIETYAFSNMKNIKKVILPNTVQFINGGVFYQCPLLSEVCIPASVNSIGFPIFDQCSETPMIASGTNSYAKVYAENNGYQWKEWNEPIKEPILELSFDESLSGGSVLSREGDRPDETNPQTALTVDPTISEQYTESMEGHGKALLLDGTYAVGYPLTSLGDSYTLSFWVKPEEVAQYGAMLFLASDIGEKPFEEKEVKERTDFYWLNITKSFWVGETLPTVWSRNGKTEAWPWYGKGIDQGFPSPLPKGEWNHVLVTVNGKKQTYEKDCVSSDCYINGELWCSGSVAADMFLGKDTYFYIGGNFWDKLVKGAVDDVRIYNCFMDADQAKQIAAMEGCKTNMVTIDKGESVTENKITYQIYQDGHAVVTGCDKENTAVTIPEMIQSHQVTEIASNAFQNCVNLKQMILPNSLKTIGSYAFENCSGLTGLTLPKSLEKTGYGIFKNCTSLKEVNFDKEATKLPDRLFSECSSLKVITLPDNITYTGAKLLENCDATLYCHADSETAISLIDREIPFKTIGTSGSNSKGQVLNTKESYFEQNTANGMIDYTVKYAIKETSAANDLENKTIQIHIPSCAMLAEGSVAVNGTLIGNYEYKNGWTVVGSRDNLLIVPVTENAGTLRFSIHLEKDGNLASFARFCYTKQGEKKEETIGILHGEKAVLTLLTDPYTNTGKLKVEGAATADAEIVFSIDGKNVGKVTASKAGTYQTTISIPEPVNGKTYEIKAEILNGEQVLAQAKTQVIYQKELPVLEELVMYYQDHINNNKYILTDHSLLTGYVVFYPLAGYSFTASFTNRKEIDHVYIVSTRNNVKKYIEAFWDTKKQCYVANGYFDKGNINYVPGKISVEYTLKTSKKKISVGNNVDFSSESFTAKLKDGWKKSIIEVKENANASTNINASDRVLNAKLSSDLTGMEGISLKLTETIVSNQNEVNKEEILKEKEGQIVKEFTENKKDYIYCLDYSNLDKVSITIYNLTEKKQYHYTLEVEGNWNRSMRELLIQVISAGMEEDYLSAYYPANDSYETMLQNIYASDMSEEEANTAIKDSEKLFEQGLVLRVITAMIAGNEKNKDGRIQMDDLLFAMMSNVSNEIFEKLYKQRVVNILSSGNGYHIRWIIDPSGYVYEAVKENRLENVKATIYYKETNDSEPIEWKAEEYDQQNPLITGKDGVYAWDVPAGLWQVKYELDGYETVYSDWMEVPPPQVDVNIAMISNKSPEAEAVNIYEDSAEVIFTQYMKPETVENIIIKDEKGTTISYTLDYSKEESGLDGTIYAKEYKLGFDKKLSDSSGTYTLTIPETVKNYAEKPMKEITVSKKFAKKPVLKVEKEKQIEDGKTTVIPVTIENYTGEQELICNSSFEEMVSVDKVTIDKDGKAKITVTAKMPGEVTLKVGIKDTSESIDIRLFVNGVSAYTFGDVTMDQKIDSGDALVVLKMAANLLEGNATEESAADVNGDGKVDSSDALLILKYAAQLIEDF